jgi:hypothetical protein
MWSPYAYAAPSPRAEAGGERRNAYKPSDRQKAPQQTEGCALETRGGLRLETRFGVYTVEPVVATICGAHAGRYSRKRRGAAEEAADVRKWVPGLERRLSAEAKASRGALQATAAPQMAISEEWS